MTSLDLAYSYKLQVGSLYGWRCDISCRRHISPQRRT